MKEAKDRILYMDIAKGLCMFLVVMIHTGVPEVCPHVYTAKVVLFFILSGFFFRDNIPWKEFLKKKTRTLLIPFLCFYIFSYIIYYGMVSLKPSFATLTEAKGILDCFTQKNYFNGPLWFLLSLYEIQLIVFFIRRVVKKEIVQWAIYLMQLWGGVLFVGQEFRLTLQP